jgi:hypothetical protein
MRDKIFGAIGVIWGGAVLASAFLRSAPAGSAAYAAGNAAGIAFGALLFIVGGYFLLRGSKKSK